MSLLTNALFVNTPRLNGDVSVYLLLRFQDTHRIDTLRTRGLAFTALLWSLSNLAKI